MRVAYFTAAVTGAGHIVRGLALHRALIRAEFPCEFKLFAPTTPFSETIPHDFEAVALDRVELKDPRRAEASDPAAKLRAFAPDLLIVDVFWAPLVHIMPLLKCPKWLLVRNCPPAWFIGPRDLRFPRGAFAEIIAIEPTDSEVPTLRVPPVVICNPDECQPAGALRARLGLPDDRRLVVVSHAGQPGEIDRLRAAPGTDAAVFDLHDMGAPFPAAAWLGGADEIHCGAGYNLFWEARWLGYHARCRFRPFPRQMEDQAWRVRTGATVVMRENGADVIARRIVSG